jgi:stage V sporulation protein G
MSLTITNIKLSKPGNDKSKILAFAKVTFEDAFCVTGIKLIDGAKGMFIGMPTIKKKEEFIDICFPVNTETRKMLTDAIIKEYKRGDTEEKPW